MKTSLFFVGQIVDHQKFGYRGVIFGVDARFGLSEEWYEQVAKSRPPKDEPWYHVLVDRAMNATYVAQRHLVASEDLGKIENPFLEEHFRRFDGARYVLRRPVH